MMKQKLETDVKVKMLNFIVMEEEHALQRDGAKVKQDDIHLTFIYVIFKNMFIEYLQLFPKLLVFRSHL